MLNKKRTARPWCLRPRSRTTTWSKTFHETRLADGAPGAKLPLDFPKSSAILPRGGRVSHFVDGQDFLISGTEGELAKDEWPPGGGLRIFGRLGTLHRVSRN